MTRWIILIRAGSLDTDEEAGATTTPPPAIAWETAQQPGHVSTGQSSSVLALRMGWVMAIVVVVTALLVAISFWY